MKIVIIEDESAAANHLNYLLHQLKIDHEVLAVLETVAEAIEWFTKIEPPDLIFSDIQLADGVSFDIYEQVSVKAPIIFTTAFDEYAIRAFKLNSIDYILKPIDEASLGFAIEKFKNQALITQEKWQELIGQHTFFPKNYRKSFLVKYRNQLIPLKSAAFAFFYRKWSGFRAAIRWSQMGVGLQTRRPRKPTRPPRFH
ncbi:MAG: response regulator [Spirosomataceae bacterium]